MGFKETIFGFDEAEFRRMLKGVDTEQLEAWHRQRNVTEMVGACGIGAGIGAAPFTLGVGLLGSFYSARRASVASQQREIIEEELKSRPGDAKPRDRKRDLALGAAIGVLGAAVGPLIPVGLHEIAGGVATDVASGTVTSAAFAGATHAVPHISTHLATQAAAHGTEHAMRETIIGQAHGFHLTNATPNFAPPSYVPGGEGAAYVVGESAGAKAVFFAEGKAIGTGVEKATTAIGERAVGLRSSKRR